ncbi:MAG: GGDEF domain-containing protein [Gammaproteobacteria bacterium]
MTEADPPPDTQQDVRNAVLRKVALVTAGAVAASLAATLVLRVFFGPLLDGVVPSLTVAALVPGLIAPIGSWRLLTLTERLRIANLELQRLSETDPLTQVLNRRRLLELADQHVLLAARHGHPVSILLLDFDHFKAINDRFGHLVGDQVLVGAAAAIKRLCRRTDALARFGGEEFILLLPHTGRAGAERVAERIRAEVRQLAFADPARRQPLDLTVTVSIGGATWGASAIPTEAALDALISLADTLLYAAKAAGRDCCRIEALDTVPGARA